MSNTVFTFSNELWPWTSKNRRGNYFFISIPEDIGREIETLAAVARLELGLSTKTGWGAVKVEATIGETNWQTSIFPGIDDTRYVLPVKAKVRKAENIAVGDQVTCILTLK